MVKSERSGDEREWGGSGAGGLGGAGVCGARARAAERGGAGRDLDLAREVAHNVVRPGAPVTAFLLGVAVGRGADLEETRARLAGWVSGR